MGHLKRKLPSVQCLQRLRTYQNMSPVSITAHTELAFRKEAGLGVGGWSFHGMNSRTPNRFLPPQTQQTFPFLDIINLRRPVLNGFPLGLGEQYVKPSSTVEKSLKIQPWTLGVGRGKLSPPTLDEELQSYLLRKTPPEVVSFFPPKKVKLV